MDHPLKSVWLFSDLRIITPLFIRISHLGADSGILNLSLALPRTRHRSVVPCHNGRVQLRLDCSGSSLLVPHPPVSHYSNWLYVFRLGNGRQNTGYTRSSTPRQHQWVRITFAEYLCHHHPLSTLPADSHQTITPSSLTLNCKSRDFPPPFFLYSRRILDLAKQSVLVSILAQIHVALRHCSSGGSSQIAFSK